MELRQLAAITAVADQGTFSAAADVLGTVQSNVSAHVANLERELGVALFDRSAGRLTEEGEAVVARARRVMAELDAMVADVAAVRHDVSGAARLGVIGTTGRWLAPLLLDRAAERFPKVRLAVVEGNSTALEALLLAGRIDIGVAQLPVGDDDLAETRLFDEDLVLVVPAGSELASRRELDLTDLKGMPLLLPLPGTALRDELDAAVRPAGFELTPKAELDGVRLIASLTFEGRGPAILPATAVPEFLRHDWAAVSVRGLPRRQVGMVVRRRGLPSAPARAIGDILTEVVSEELAGGPAEERGLHPPDAS